MNQLNNNYFPTEAIYQRKYGSYIPDITTKFLHCEALKSAVYPKKEL